MADYYTCDWFGNCYHSRWDSWGRWVFLAIVIISFFFLVSLFLVISARRRRRSGLQPFLGTGWLAPQQRYNIQQAQPGPPGPAGYYPPPQQGQDPYGQHYTPPPYTPTPQFTGTTSSDAYYAPPPNQAYEMSNREQQPQQQQPYANSPPPVPVNTHPTGSSYQSNNPYNQPAAIPPAHIYDHNGASKV